MGGQLKTGSNSIVIQSLARFQVTGNSGTHLLSIQDGNQNVMGSVPVTMNGSGWIFGNFPNESYWVTLNANSTYYIFSGETNGQDSWYDFDSTVDNSFWAPADVTFSAAAYVYQGIIETDGGANNCYVPLNFLYYIAPHSGEISFIGDFTNQINAITTNVNSNYQVKLADVSSFPNHIR